MISRVNQKRQKPKHTVHSSKSCHKQAVLTIATGKSVYAEMAVNLALSIHEWSPEIKIQIATDLKEKHFYDLTNVEVLKYEKGNLGESFSAKLQLDKISRSEKTLFIDCDCLAYKKVEPIFDIFKNTEVGVVGSSIAGGEWFGDISKVCERFKIKEMPKFNGGLYYFEKGEICTKVYRRARELEKQYDQIGLVRLRGRPNDELLMAIAMAENGLKAIKDDGSIIADPQAYPGRMSLKILEGRAKLTNPVPPSKHHVAWNSLREANPIFVHFLGSGHELPQYQADVIYLRRKKKIVSKYAAYAISRLFVLGPGLLMQKSKNLLRPIYRALFGIRAIKRSKRI